MRESLFEEFWRAYPRKVGKGAARKAWGRVPADVAFADLMVAVDGLARRHRALPAQDRRFTPHPTTWLNQERWDDEDDAVVTPEPAAWDAIRAAMSEQPGVKELG